MMAIHNTLVDAMTLDARPVSVEVKLYVGFFDVRVIGRNGERGFYRIPMRHAGSPRHRVGMVEDKRKSMANVEVICFDPRGRCLGKAVSGEQEVMHVMKNFDSIVPLVPLDVAALDAAAPPLLLQAAPDVVDAPAMLLQASTPAADALPIQDALFRPTAALAHALPTPGKTSVVYSRRSARLKASEQATRLTMLEKATLLKKHRLNDKSSVTPVELLPADELLELAVAGTPPLARKDVLQFVDACGISEIDLNKVAPEFSDV
ncbi:hypothetical protein ZWY2020_038921 [Hordeum vulgare]|nr:hypothetical protein ZWY2020_038921 [Hordeum vulgare]